MPARRFRDPTSVYSALAKPYFIIHAPQVRFIEKSSPAAAFFNGTPWGNRTLNCPLGEAPRGAFLIPYKSPKILDFTSFSGISLLVNSRPKPANFSWFFHLFEMGERFCGVFFQNFLKKFFASKKPPISLVIEVNRRRVEIFIILVYNRKLREGQI